MISGVDSERKFVSVEWFENGETKGKEVVKCALIRTHKHTCSSRTRRTTAPRGRLWV